MIAKDPLCSELSDKDVCRFWKRVNKSAGGCWNWNAGIGGNGYGVFFIRRGLRPRAHRVSWIILNGAIPGGLTIDHLCKNKLCVNPEHLEPVTLRVNILRSDSAAAKNARKIFCSRGHALVLTDVGSIRDCAKCVIERNRNYYRDVVKPRREADAVRSGIPRLTRSESGRLGGLATARNKILREHGTEINR